MISKQLTWQECHELIREMRDKLETQQSVTRTISRINYTELLGVLRNHTVFQHDKSIKLKVNCQDGIIVVRMERKV